MLEKVKQFFAAIASAAIVLYAVGYVSEYAHARMLGIDMVEPPAQYYLVSGGIFFLSTLFNLFTALITHWYYWLLFLMAGAGLVYFHRYVQKKNQIRGQVLYTLLVLIIIIFYTLVVTTALQIPLEFRDLLLRGYGSIEGTGLLTALEKELRSGILNDETLNVYYCLLWLFTVISALLTYLLWKRGREQEPVGNKAKSLSALTRAFRGINKRLQPALKWIMTLITAVLVVFIPIVHGILVKPNHYPRVKINTAQGVELIPGRGPGNGKQTRLWLLRENQQELLVHAVYLDNDTGNTVYKILVVNKDKVETIEILNKTFILETK